MNPELKSLARRLLASSIAVSFLFLAASLGFTRWGVHVLPPRAQTLSEVALKQGLYCETAGDYEGAEKHFECALAGQFHGEANRNHCEKRLGVVLYRLGRHEDALIHLTIAQESPLHSLNGFGPLVDTLVALERWEPARSIAERWISEAAGDPSSHADALCALGRIALHFGDLTTAGAQFQAACALQPGHAAEAGLAQVYAAQRDMPRARDTLAAYLAHAPWDDATAASWKQLESWRSPRP